MKQTVYGNSETRDQESRALNPKLRLDRNDTQMIKYMCSIGHKIGFPLWTLGIDYNWVLEIGY